MIASSVFFPSLTSWSFSRGDRFGERSFLFPRLRHETIPARCGEQHGSTGQEASRAPGLGWLGCCCPNRRSPRLPHAMGKACTASLGSLLLPSVTCLQVARISLLHQSPRPGKAEPCLHPPAWHTAGISLLPSLFQARQPRIFHFFTTARVSGIYDFSCSLLWHPTWFRNMQMQGRQVNTTEQSWEHWEIYSRNWSASKAKHHKNSKSVIHLTASAFTRNNLFPFLWTVSIWSALNGQSVGLPSKNYFFGENAVWAECGFLLPSQLSAKKIPVRAQVPKCLKMPVDTTEKVL